MLTDGSEKALFGVLVQNLLVWPRVLHRSGDRFVGRFLIADGEGDFKVGSWARDGFCRAAVLENGGELAEG